MNSVEDLDVFKLAHQLTIKIYAVTKTFPKEETYSLVDQMRRAAAMERPKNWIEFVNDSERESELDDLRSSAQRGRPYGSEDWMIRTAKQLGLESTMRSRGRPKHLKRLPTPLFLPQFAAWQRGCQRADPGCQRRQDSEFLGAESKENLGLISSPY